MVLRRASAARTLSYCTSRGTVARGQVADAVVALVLICAVVVQCDDDDGLTGVLEMDSAMRMCRYGQEVRERQLSAGRLVNLVERYLSACVIGHNHQPLTFFALLTTRAW